MVHVGCPLNCDTKFLLEYSQFKNISKYNLEIKLNKGKLKMINN